MVAAAVSLALPTIFPDVASHSNPYPWLTPLGAARASLVRDLEGSVGVAQRLLVDGEPNPGDAILRDGWNETTWLKDAYAGLANAGRRRFAGPLLVLQGTADVFIADDVTRATVDATCDMFAGEEDEGEQIDLEFVSVNGVGHTPVLDATRQLWLQWIEDRFSGGQDAAQGCKQSDFESFLPIERYQAVGTSFSQWAGAPEYSYQTILGI